jgi:hypothetical protein
MHNNGKSVLLAKEYGFDTGKFMYLAPGSLT